MSKRSRTLEMIPLVPPPNADKGSADGRYAPTRHFLEIEVSYDDGKALFSSARPRGFYLRVTPVTRQTTGSGGEMHGFSLFSGSSKLVVPAKRFSDKALDAAVALAKSDSVAPWLASLKQHVIDHNKLTVASVEAPTDANATLGLGQLLTDVQRDAVESFSTLPRKDGS